LLSRVISLRPAGRGPDGDVLEAALSNVSVVVPGDVAWTTQTMKVVVTLSLLEGFRR